MAAERKYYAPEVGKELRDDDTVLDVTKWREDQVQQRNNQAHIRGFDTKVYGLMLSVLKELKGIKEELINIKEGE